LALAATLLATAFGRILAVTEPPPDPIRLGLYEWMATAPIVIAADVVADDGKFVQAVTRTPIKGGLRAATVVLVDQRQANRDREPGVPASDLVKGRGYLLLLSASTRGKNEAHQVFDLVRGVKGSKELPVEGSDATIAAAVRLAEIQERANDAYLWASLPDLLQDENPLLVDAALDLYVKFRRESVAQVPVLQPLLEHPRPDFRRRAVLLLGRILAKTSSTDLPERPQIIAELTGRARRDEDVGARREAVTALAPLPDTGIDETLRAVAQDDPDQDVRFEAEKSAFVRSGAQRTKRSD
jgi:hypothetical protein